MSSPVYICSTSSIQQNYFKFPTQIFLTISHLGHSQHSLLTQTLCFPLLSCKSFSVPDAISSLPSLSYLKHNFCLDVPVDKARDWKPQLRAAVSRLSLKPEVWQTQQELPGSKAKTILHIPEQRGNTRAGPVTVSNSSPMILWNNWTPHSRAVSLSCTAVHSYCTGFQMYHLVFRPKKYLFPCSLQSKNIVGYSCITKWKELVAETEQYPCTSNSHSKCISLYDFSKPPVSTLNLQFMFYIFKFNRSRKITKKFSPVEHSSAGQGTIHARVHQLWTSKNTEHKI